MTTPTTEKAKSVEAAKARANAQFALSQWNARGGKDVMEQARDLATALRTLLATAATLQARAEAAEAENVKLREGLKAVDHMCLVISSAVRHADSAENHRATSDALKLVRAALTTTPTEEA